MLKIGEIVKRLSSYISSSNPVKWDFFLFLIWLVILYLCFEFYTPISETGKYTLDIDLAISAKQDENGNYYVIDSGHNRLICFDENATVKYAISNVTDDESDGLYIDDFVIYNDLIYISASEWDGMILSKEVLLVYDKEKYVRTIATRDYSNQLVNKHRFHGLTVNYDALRYIEADKSSISVHKVNLKTDEDEIERNIDYHNAFNAISNCVFLGNKLYILDKSGKIALFINDKAEQLYSTKWQNETRRIPYDMAVSKKGEIYFTDIRGREIVKVDTDAKSTTNVFEPTDSLTVNLTNDGNGFLLVDSEGVQLISGEEVTTFLTLDENTNQIIFKIVYIILITTLVFVLCLLIYRVWIVTLNNKPAPTKIIAGVVLVVIFVVSAVTCKMQIDKFSETYRQELMSKLENSAYITVNQLPSEMLDKINNAEDFYGEEYKEILKAMENSFPLNVDINRQTYCDILRLDESGEKLTQ